MLMAFKYLVQVLNASDDKWLEVVANLQKYQSRWAHFCRILGQEGADPQTLTPFTRC